MVGLMEFKAGANLLYGTIPVHLGELPFLQTVDLSYNPMSCCSNSSDMGKMLPEFLEFGSQHTQRTVPRSPNTTGIPNSLYGQDPSLSTDYTNIMYVGG